MILAVGWFPYNNFSNFVYCSLNGYYCYGAILVLIDELKDLYISNPILTRIKRTVHMIPKTNNNFSSFLMNPKIITTLAARYITVPKTI